MDEARLLRQFVAEAEDLAETLQRDLETLAAQQASGRVEPDLLNRLFRSAHSIKGMAGMAGASAVARAAHRFEDLLDDLRMGRVAPSVAIVSGCARVADDLGDLIGQAGRGLTSDSDAERIEAAVDALRRGASDAGDVDLAAFVELDERVRATLTEYEEHRLRANVRERRPIYEARVAFGLAEFGTAFRGVSDALASAGEVLSTLPGAAGNDPTIIAFRIVFASDASRETLDAIVVPAGGEIVVLSRYPEEPAGTVAVETELRGSSTVRVDVTSLDDVAVLAESLALRSADLAASTDSMAEQLGLGPRDRFDLRQKARAIERGFVELEERVVEMRLVALGPTFARARRRAGTVAAELGRDVECVSLGDDVRLDKSIVDAIAEPLVHLVNNAVDHGIEPPDERVASGKPARGRVTIAAEQRGNRVAVSVSDDGRGLDVAALAAAAERLGHDASGVATAFLPGVTTAGSVSDVSGRGVGLDAVAAAVAALGGVVDASSELGRGASFTVTLPTTLVVASVFLATAGGSTYAVDVSQIVEVAALEPGGVTLGRLGPTVEWRGVTLPFYPLATLARASGEAWEPPRSVPSLIVRIGDGSAAVAVDALIGEREVVVKSLGRHGRRLSGVTGAVELGGGRVALLVDVAALVTERHRGAAKNAR